MRHARKSAFFLILALVLTAPALSPQAKAAAAEGISPMMIQEDIDAEYIRLINAKEGDVVKVWADEVSGVPTRLLQAIKGRDVTMLFTMIDYSWEIGGLSVKDLPADRDNYYLRLLPAAGDLPGLSPGSVVLRFETPYKGDLPFLARLKIATDGKYGGKLLYLYQHDTDKNKLSFKAMTFAASGSNGAVTLPFTQGGFFVISASPAAGKTLYRDTAGHWAAGAIDLTSSVGLFEGTEPGIFSPEKGMTRGMFITLLGRLYGVEGTADSGFLDVKAGDYWAPYIGWAKKEGIVSGVAPGYFAPSLLLTREQAAVIFDNFLQKEFSYVNGENTEKTAFSDDGLISSWAKGSASYMQKLGLMEGTGGNIFSPQKTMTRAEGAAVFARMMEGLFGAK